MLLMIQLARVGGVLRAPPLTSSTWLLLQGIFQWFTGSWGGLG